MVPASFFAASRVVIVAGKGGVGKTVVSAAFARAAAMAGLDTVLVEIDGRASTHRSFGTSPLSYGERELWHADGPGRVRGRSIAADRALVDYLHDHGLARVAGRLERSGALEVVATATPGLKDLLVLGKIKQLEAARAHDLVVVDAPASGHAITFLRAPTTFLDLAGAGPIHHQAREASAMLRDPGSKFMVELIEWIDPLPAPGTDRIRRANDIGLFRMAWSTSDCHGDEAIVRAAGSVPFAPTGTLSVGDHLPLLYVLFWPGPTGECLELIETGAPRD